MNESETTSDHDAIRPWAERRGGRPAAVRATGEDDHAGLARIDFDRLEKAQTEIEWNGFFRRLEEADLALLYQDRTRDGELGRFHKFVRRSSAG